MGPLIHDSELSHSTHDRYDHKTDIAPLYDTTIHEHRRQVSFDDMDTVHEVMCLNEFTSKEKKTTWYNMKDMIRMKEQARTDARIIDCGIIILGTCVSNRGIEGKTREGGQRKGKLRLNAYAAVFSEIEFQERQGIIDDEVLADTYYIHSSHSAKEALKIGQEDEAEAMAIHNSELKDLPSFLQFHPT